jgi:DNA-binding response OmpR family regulator
MTSHSTISDGWSPSKVSLHALLLCIDDNEAVLDCVTSILEKHGYRTLPATCGRIGIQLFKENEVDLVILDHDMPNMDGRETAEELRHLNSKVPIIMSSGVPDIAARVGRLVDAYIPKGIEYSFLLSAISNLLPAKHNTRHK